MPKVHIESALYERARKAADAIGYSSLEEFVAHCIENELKKLNIEEAEKHVTNQLRGLGYIE
ncbi:MAG: hypothetical protein RMJ56_13490 [Gemmataceae bacterium]|nr:hypothetical protein [Gemmata sp.]MDW8198606.1 hypothetical protein [Gemmataceae bacterium]